MRKLLFWKTGIPLLLFLLLLTNSSCSFGFRRDAVLESTKEIVFLQWSGDRGKTGAVLLMQADGSGIVTLLGDTYEMMPIWTIDKQDILMLYPLDRESSFMIFGKLGLYSGKANCSSANFYGRSRWASMEELIIVQTGQKEGTPFHPKIVLWNFYSCRASNNLYEEETFDRFRDPDYSIKGVVVFTRQSGDGRSIEIINSNQSGNKKIAEGFGATWSPDGMQIVFTGAEGLYTSDGEGTSIRKAVDLTAYYPMKDGKIMWDEWPPMAVWSPDGRYLLFHRPNKGTYELVKFEIETGIETVLYKGGMYPDWR
jgi:hypothetical protein